MTAPPRWQPSGSLASLQARAQACAAVRRFMADRQILEVHTPVLVEHTTTDPGITSLQLTASGLRHWLRTSPEFHMKRLLAAGAPDLYQLGPAFRADEAGRLHEPEFTLLEWYRHDLDAEAMAGETCELLVTVAAALGVDWTIHGALTYRDAFLRTVELDPLAATEAQLLDRCAGVPGWHPDLATDLRGDRPAQLDFIASHSVWPALPGDALVAVHDFPVELALLARRDEDDLCTAARFEVFFGGVELANGYHELQDPVEHRRRFADDNAQRVRRQLAEVTPDARLLAALEAGLPHCAGVAVGLERTLMCALGHTSIAEVVSFRSGS